MPARRRRGFHAGDRVPLCHFPSPATTPSSSSSAVVRKTFQHAMTNRASSSMTPLPVHQPATDAGPSNIKQIKFERRAYPGKWTRCMSSCLHVLFLFLLLFFCSPHGFQSISKSSYDDLGKKEPRADDPQSFARCCPKSHRPRPVRLRMVSTMMVQSLQLLHRRLLAVLSPQAKDTLQQRKMEAIGSLTRSSWTEKAGTDRARMGMAVRRTQGRGRARVGRGA